MANMAKRTHYTAGFKMRAIIRAKAIGIRAASREMNIGLSNVSKWLRMENTIRRMPANRMRLRNLHPAKWPVLEEKLATWVKSRQSNSESVSTLIIHRKAKNMAKKMNLKDFTPGKSWCSKFMKRNNISLRARNHGNDDVIVDGIVPNQDYYNGGDPETWMSSGPACVPEMLPATSSIDDEINAVAQIPKAHIKPEVDNITETINNVIVLVQEQSLPDVPDVGFTSNMSEGKSEDVTLSTSAQTQQWCNCRLYPILLRDLPFPNTSGLKTNLDSLTSPYSYFRSIFTDSLLDIIVKETNKYAERKVAFITPSVKWAKFTKAECMRFVAVLLHMGVVILPNKSLYWCTNSLYSTNFFSKQVRRDRFYQLLTYIQLGDASQNNELLRCHLAFSCFNQIMKSAYSPNPNLTIDRSTLFSFPKLKSSATPELQNYKGYGYMLCEDDGLVVQVLIFTEIDSYVEPSVQKTLTCFMKQSLESEQSLVVANDLTKELSAKRPSKNETNSMNGDILVLKWTETDQICTVRREPKRNVVRTDSCLKEPVKFPLGVEKVTALTTMFYNISHISQLWNRKILFKLFHLFVSNGFILYNRYSGNKCSMLDFHNEIVEGLIDEASELQPRRAASPN